MEKYERLDRMIDVAITNLFTEGKNNQTIYIRGIKYKKSHLAFIHIANIVEKLFNYNIEYEISWFKKFLLQLKTKIKLKKCKSLQIGKIVYCDNFIDHIEEAYKEAGAFEEMYDEYYERKKK